MDLFKNGNLQIKNTGSYFNGSPIFDIFELIFSKLDGGKQWHFVCSISAKNSYHAFEKYENG